MIKIGLGTSSIYPLGLKKGFQLAGEVGYDGVEVMVTQDSDTRSADALKKLIDVYGLPVLSLHAPVLLLTHFVWGRDPEQKLWKTARLAAEVGAPTIVVHPPFTWQNGYSKNFLTIVKNVEEETGVTVAVENMFPWKYKNKQVKAYSPSWDIIEEEANSLTIDFSHAALSKENSFDMIKRLSDKVKHVHLCDGTSPGADEKDKIFDEHLIPGRGNQPIKESLQYLDSINWEGSIVAEVNTRKSKSEDDRKLLLQETLDYARNSLTSATTNH